MSKPLENFPKYPHQPDSFWHVKLEVATSLSNLTLSLPQSLTVGSALPASPSLGPDIDVYSFGKKYNQVSPQHLEVYPETQSFSLHPAAQSPLYYRGQTIIEPGQSYEVVGNAPIIIGEINLTLRFISNASKLFSLALLGYLSTVELAMGEFEIINDVLYSQKVATLARQEHDANQGEIDALLALAMAADTRSRHVNPTDVRHSHSQFLKFRTWYSKV